MSRGPQQPWESYEVVARHLLGEIALELGLKLVEGEQVLTGESGAKWKIEGKGVLVDGDEAFVIIECRRYTTSRLKQEQVGGFANRIRDTGASGGILVSPLGLQDGAKLVADAANITSVLLDENSTSTEYLLRFLNRILAGLADTARATDNVTAELARGARQDHDH